MRFVKVKGASKSFNDIWEELILPAKRVVCPVCDGVGTHVDPAIDGDGLTAEDLEDDSFRENYMSGAYDVPCDYCRGNKVVEEIDEEACRTRLSWWKGLIRYRNYEHEMNRSRVDSEWERRYCG